MRNRDQNISDVLVRLRDFHQESSGQLWSTLLRWIEDPLKPKSSRDYMRIHPILLLLLIILLLTVVTFFGFSWVQR